MKIHTNGLMAGDIVAIKNTMPPPFNIELTDEGYGSRSHDRAYEIRATGSSKSAPRNMPGRKAATYDEWGAFLAGLFSADPYAKCGNYDGAQDFIVKTKGEFSVAGFDNYGRPDDD